MHGTDTVHGALEQEGVETRVEELGGAPCVLALPTDEDSLVRVLRRAYVDRWRVVPVGLASKLAWCRPELGATERPDLLLSTRRLDGVVAYVPADGTLTAQAGCRMAALANEVAAHGHRLTPDVAHPDGATLAGTLAAGVSGADRLLRGPSRHHVLGMRAVLADGTVTRTGGRLVKNVTGFDLHRLYCGSRGTLAVLLEASLRLFPAPEGERTWTVARSSASEAFDTLRAIEATRVRPAAVTLSRSGSGPWQIVVHGLGHERQLRQNAQELAAALGAAPPAAELSGEDAAGAAAAARDLSATDERAAAFAIGVPPTGLEPLVTELLGAPELGSDDWNYVLRPGVATLELFGTRPGAAAELTSEMTPEAALALAARVRAYGGQLIPRRVPLAVHTALAPRADSVATDWMLRLAEQFDPGGILASPLFPCRRDRAQHDR